MTEEERIAAARKEVADCEARLTAEQMKARAGFMDERERPNPGEQVRFAVKRLDLARGRLERLLDNASGGTPRPPLEGMEEEISALIAEGNLTPKLAPIVRSMVADWGKPETGESVRWVMALEG